MAERKTTAPAWYALISLPLAIALAVTFIPAPPAAAQDRPRNVLEMLFGPPIERAQPQRRQAAPQREMRRQQARQPQAKQRRSSSRSQQRRSQRRNAAASAPAPAPVVEAVAKSENARDVLVVGDFLAGSLARGLTDVLASNRDVEIIGKANGSSGLVRQDYYDWIDKLPGLIEETGAEMVVVMIGSNDRQAIGSNAVRSEAWTTEYVARTERMAEIVEDAGLPLLWVGTPPFQSQRMTEDMVFFNDLYKRAAEGAGGEFVDIWGGFTDANGAYTASGPDPEGQPARLRNSDGITMTPAGQAKLAYYVERPLVKRLGLSVDDMLMSLAPQQLPEGELGASAGSPAVPAGPVTSTAPIALTDPALVGGETLLGAETGAPGPAALASLETPRDRLVESGSGLEGTSGRADAFNWTGKGGAVSPVTQENAIVSHGSTSLEALTAEPAPPAAPAPADAAPGAPSPESEAGGSQTPAPAQ